MSGIVDIQGRTKADNADRGYAFTYQWVRVDSLNAETDIAGATDATYTLKRFDAEHTVKVRVMFRDDSRNREQRTSDPFPPSGTVPLPPPCAGVWCATLTVPDLGGGDLGCSNSITWGLCTDADRLSEDEFTHPFGGTGYAVTSVLVTAGGQLQLSLSADIATASEGLVLHVGDDSFNFVDADTKGNRTRYWNSSGLSWTAGGEVDLRLTDSNTTAATGMPNIAGVAQAGQTLTARKGDIDDADGEPANFPDEYTFQWVRVDANATSSPMTIAGATAPTYVPVAADVGKSLLVRVSFIDGDGVEETVESAPSDAVLAAPGGLLRRPARQRLVRNPDRGEVEFWRRGP